MKNRLQRPTGEHNDLADRENGCDDEEEQDSTDEDGSDEEDDDEIDNDVSSILATFICSLSQLRNLEMRKNQLSENFYSKLAQQSSLMKVNIELISQMSVELLR